MTERPLPPVQEQHQVQTLKVTLLGTGGPTPRVERFGPSTFVEAGSEKFVFDCGRGVTQRLFQLRCPFSDLTTLFLTHLHSDHVVGIPDLWLTGWFLGRDVPLRVWGPTGTGEMMAHLQRAYEFDTRIRREFEALPAEGARIVTTEISAGVVYKQNDVKITAFPVDHGHVKPSFGYRIDYAGRSAVLSGDTRASEHLLRVSMGVDLLIHPVIVVEPQVLKSERVAKLLKLFSTPDQVAEIFGRAKPRLAVYTHHNTAKDLIALTRNTYSGAVEVGEDLMTIEVGEQVYIRRLVP